MENFLISVSQLGEEGLEVRNLECYFCEQFDIFWCERSKLNNNLISAL